MLTGRFPEYFINIGLDLLEIICIRLFRLVRLRKRGERRILLSNGLIVTVCWVNIELEPFSDIQTEHFCHFTTICT